MPDPSVPSRWLSLSIRNVGEVDAGIILDRLMALGATGVEERDGELVTYLRPPDDPESRVAEIRDLLQGALPGGGSVEIAWGWQPHEEWSETWRRGLAPRRVGRSLLISPSWMDPDPGPGDLVIRIDPGMAFGTSEHETTRGCLRLLEEAVREGDRIVDVGAGTGILSIAAALLGAAEVVAAESDDFAAEAARENRDANRVTDRIRILRASVDSPGLRSLGPVDGIVANIRSRVLETLLPGARDALGPHGWLILGGVLSDERNRLLSRARHVGLVPEEEIVDGEWWSGRLRKVEGSAAEDG